METRSLPLTSTRDSSNHFSLNGKSAIITGGGSGIGQAIALRFAASGAAVRIVDINARQAEVTAKQIVDIGGEATAHPCDITEQQQVLETFQQIFAKGKIEILVNNAGISHIGTVETTTEEDFDRLFRVNVKGIYNGIHACVGHMKSNGGGVILNMASIAGSAALPDRFAYSMSKGAVIAMTYSVAKDYLQHNIRCNCISPARIHTPFVDSYLEKYYPGREKEMYEKLAKSQPVGRMGRPEEVASLALFLCSEEAAFVTGVDYPLDGGFLSLRG
jgi:Dehydrogenases with different specificities (related to short-chain alcohol dehydrogenases)